MTTLFAYLDGLPPGPVLLFGLGWLVFLLTILTGFRRGREPELCDRCGQPWDRTRRGNAVHVCRPGRDRAYP